MTTVYKDFRIGALRDDDLMKMVDDFDNHISQEIMAVDLAKLALADISACKFLTPLTHDQANFLKIASGSWIGPLTPVLKPNPIESRHIVASGRVRNLVHSGILGLLATRLLHDPTQVSQHRRSTFNALSIIKRANNEAGHAHVKYSIHEFQCIHNVGSRHFCKNHLRDLTHDQALEMFNSLDTPENRERFLAEYRTLQQTDAMTQSRVIEKCDDNADNSLDACMSCNNA